MTGPPRWEHDQFAPVPGLPGPHLGEPGPNLPVRPPKRQRVVLAERRRTRRVVRTLAEVEEQTGIGEMLLNRLLRSQLSLAAWLAAAVGVVLLGTPLILVAAPGLGTVNVFGFRLVWLLLTVGIYPVLIGIGAIYTWRAGRIEQEFVKQVED